MEKRGETQDKIRKAVIELMGEIDFLKITVRMVTEKSGVSRSTFYRYYDSVDAVVLEMENEILDIMDSLNRISLIDTNLKNKGESTYSRLARSSVLKEYETFNLVINGPHGDAGFRKKCIATIKKHLSEKLRKTGKNDMDLEFYLEFMAGGICQMIDYWLSKRPEVSAEEFEQIQQRTFCFFDDYYEFE